MIPRARGRPFAGELVVKLPRFYYNVSVAEQEENGVIERVESAVRAPGVIRPGTRVLCAVSGGPDSMALLHALHALAPRLGFSVCAGHVEHGIRQEASLADAAFVRSRCAALKLPFFERAVDAPALAREQRFSPEDAARTARYAALFEMADEAGAERIALAHHMEMSAVAEGVENARQAKLLRDAGCDRAQGNYFGEPMTAGEAERLLAR